jgi:transposase-like protein
MCLQKLRRAVIRPNREPLTGIVEVDETLLGGRHRVHGGRTLGDKAIVAVAVEVTEDGLGRIRLKRVPKADTDNLMVFVKAAVAPGATIVTDGWWPYAAIAAKGYSHKREVLESKGRKSFSVLPHVHRIAALLKRWILGTHQGRISWDHLDHYLEEFAFRFNRRHSRSRGQLFYRLLQQAVLVRPVSYEQLTARQALKALS